MKRPLRSLLRPKRLLLLLGLGSLFALTGLPGLSGWQTTDEAAAQVRCMFPQRDCKGAYGEVCYTPGLEWCVSGRACPPGNRVCEGHPCPINDPTCEGPPLNVSDTKELGTCFNPDIEVCNRSSAKRRPSSCPPGQRLCDGVYGTKCYTPGVDACFEGRTCAKGNRLCEGWTTARCYNPDERVCMAGTVCEFGQSLCRGNYGDGCYNPDIDLCYEGLVCHKNQRLCVTADRQFCQDRNLSCEEK